MAILEVNNLCKSFYGTKVNNNICFSIPEGTVSSVIGPNGAGKTTLFNLITGYLKPDAGHVYLEGKDIAGMEPHKIVRAGISRTFQLVRVFKRISVLENVLRGYQDLPGDTFLSALLQTSATRKQFAQKREEARAMIDYVGLSQYENQMANDLSYGQQKLVEIARALATNPKVLMLDEPLSGLNVVMIDKMLRLIDDIKSSGRTVIVIEHNTDVIKSISDQVTVLNFGEVIASGSPEAVYSDPVVVNSYLGINK